jgi:KDO2-lipid IV(A) lauroyltransferase
LLIGYDYLVVGNGDDNFWNETSPYLTPGSNTGRQGIYKVSFEVITQEAKQLDYGHITEKHAALLEAAIAQDPSRWLWSHKRWKRQAPADLNTLKSQAKVRFEERFRK